KLQIRLDLKRSSIYLVYDKGENMSYVYNPRSQLLLPLTLHPSGQMPYWNNNSTATILDVASSIKNKITLNETSSVNNDNYSDIYDGIDNIDSNNNNNNVNYLSRSDIYGEIDNTDNTNTNNNNYLFSNDTVNDNNTVTYVEHAKHILVCRYVGSQCIR
ncbi:5176_t:CDS:2, partial [Entrophospora sp. SA101]